jgi:hypothetical protein
MKINGPAPDTIQLFGNHCTPETGGRDETGGIGFTERVEGAGMQSNFHQREGRNTRNAPAYRIILINVAHSAFGNESGRKEDLPIIGFIPRL